MAFPAAPSLAQTTQRGGSPAHLPRPGLEPIVHYLGPAEVRLGLDISAMYDSNVYATSKNARDDGILVVRPTADMVLETRGDTALHAAAYVEARQHLDVTRENAVTFGLELAGGRRFSSTGSGDATLRFDRVVQPRSDPEARAPITASPRRINMFAADAGYTLRTGSFTVRLAPGFDRINFLDPSERDRNMRVYRGKMRATWQPASPVAIFVEGFVTRRDADMRRDFAGVDRDMTTYGALLGVSREVTARLRGGFGMGIFRSEPDDRLLAPFTGFAIDGRVTWTPRARTQMTLTAFRGDVATARVGASGRTDTRLSAEIEQEVRHNFLLSGEIGFRRSTFRGTGNRQDLINGRIGGEYLATRRYSLFADVLVSRRNAMIALDEFSRIAVQVGVRARF